MPDLAHTRHTLVEDTLEWPAIHQELLAECLTPYGRSHWEENPFLNQPADIERHLAEVDAVKILILRYGEPIIEIDPREPLSSIEPALKRVVKGAELNANDLGKFRATLETGTAFLRHFMKVSKKEQDQQRILSPLFDAIEFPEELTEKLSTTVSTSGDLLDEASPALSELRQKYRNQRQTIQDKLQRYLTNPDFSQVLQQPIITERDGRYVLPVQVAFKSKIPGVVHAGSSSGATVFIEPKGVIELNNSLQETLSLIQKEIRQILKDVSAIIETEEREHESLSQFINHLGRFDRRFAAARLSRKLEATAPKIETDQHLLDLKSARHPLLVLGESNKEDIIANDIALGIDPDDPQRTMVITGPNTGGKTVLLKTIGLCALMVRAGLQIPVAEGSRISVFHPIMADIGDQQSITQSLSTFSAHLENLKAMVDTGTDLTYGLVLIDEICAGTDPGEGAALARAVLDELYSKGGLTVVTTHLGELKLEAHQHPGYVNASVEFDPDNLKPTYRMIIGVPGTSNAITIAQRLGLHDTVTDKARGYLSQPLRESAELLETLEQRNRKLADELHKAESYKRSAQDAYEKVDQQRYELESGKRRTLQEFKSSLKDRVHTLEAEIKHLKKELKTAKADAIDDIEERLKEVGRQADDILGSTQSDIEKDADQLIVDDLKVGDLVQSRKLNIKGEILSLENAPEILIQAGALKVSVPLADLQWPRGKSGRKLSKQEQKSARAGSRQSQSRVIRTSPEAISLECNLLGMRVEEALLKMDQFLDKASLSGHERVSIIHGHGTGALKQAVRDYLKDSPYAGKYYPGDPQSGGDGQTIIELA